MFYPCCVVRSCLGRIQSDEAYQGCVWKHFWHRAAKPLAQEGPWEPHGGTKSVNGCLSSPKGKNGSPWAGEWLGKPMAVAGRGFTEGRSVGPSRGCGNLGPFGSHE